MANNGKVHYNFKGKRALVTGAGRGIGWDIAISLAKAGADTYALSVTKANLDKLVAEYPSIHPVCVDLADWEATRKAVEALPPIDLLVNNAAVAVSLSLLDTDPETFDNYISVNVKAALNVSQVVAKSLIARGKPGAIVNVSSICGVIAIKNLGIYCATKGALQMMSKVMAVELGKNQIRVNCVNPTLTLTDMGKNLFETEEKRNAIIDFTPLGRLAEVDEFVRPVLYLLSEDASMINGVQLLIDGGYTLT